MYFCLSLKFQTLNLNRKTFWKKLILQKRQKPSLKQIIPKLFHYSNFIPQGKTVPNTLIWNAIIPSGSPTLRLYDTNGVRSHAPSIQSHRGTKVVWQYFQPMRAPEEPRRWTWTGDFKCREVKTGFYRNRSMQTGSSGTLIGWKTGQTTFVPLCDWMEGAWLRTPVCVDLFRQNPVFTSLHLNSPVHDHRLDISNAGR
jgi:hypothetical protein